MPKIPILLVPLGQDLYLKYLLKYIVKVDKQACFNSDRGIAKSFKIKWVQPRASLNHWQILKDVRSRVWS